MRFHHLSITSITAFILAGCASTTVPPVNISSPSEGLQNEIVRVVRNGLKDPYSAKFGEITLVDNGIGACAAVNSKNAFGGYTGYQQAFLVNKSMLLGGWELLSIMKGTHELCIAAIHDTLYRQGYLGKQ